MWRWGGGVFLVLAVVAAGALFAAPSLIEGDLNKVTEHARYPIGAEARELHGRLHLADLHADTLLWGRDVLARGSTGHVDVPRLQEGRFALQVFSAVTKSPKGQNYNRTKDEDDQISLLVKVQRWPPRTWNSLLERALYQAERLNDAALRDPRALVVLRRRADVAALMARRGEGAKFVGGLLAIEGAHALEGNLDNLKRLSDAGYRMIGLHHFFDNELGGSLHGVGGKGLSPFGVQAVRAIEQAGLIVDVAHSSAAVVEDVLQISTRPVVVSHTGVRGACASPRNLSDAQMRAIAAKDGLIGIGFWEGAVCDISPAGVVKSLRYAIDLVGVDHVALGSDYDGTTTVSFDASEAAALIDAMVRARFSEEEIRKVSGENLIRFLASQLPD
jgi:membrane dipeptidase